MATLHIFLNVIDSFDLPWGLGVWECFVEPLLDIGIVWILVPFGFSALRVNIEEFCGDLLGFFRNFLCNLLPLYGAKTCEKRLLTSS